MTLNVVLFSFAAVLSLRGSRTIELKHFLLLAFNLSFLFFLFYWQLTALAYLLVFFVCNFLLMKLIAHLKYGRLGLATALILGDILFVFFCNYSNRLNSFSAIIPLPLGMLGLSFAILRLFHLIVETAKGKLIQQLTFFRYCNFILFFPLYLAGPLVHFDRFITQLESSKSLNSEQIYRALSRIVIGLFKVQVLAMIINYFSLQTVDGQVLEFIRPEKVLLAAYVYGLWLYLSFSGATDVAIGFGSLLGVTLPENFNRPFLALNIQDFWQRWHMSFMAWIKDYLYIPLLVHIRILFKGSPVLCTAISMLLSFLLLGIWHGTGWHFVTYGLFHGMGMLIFLLYSLYIKKHLLRMKPTSSLLAARLSFVLRLASWFLTWNFISIGWFFYLGQEGALWHMIGWL